MVPPLSQCPHVPRALQEPQHPHPRSDSVSTRISGRQPQGSRLLCCLCTLGPLSRGLLPIFLVGKGWEAAKTLRVCWGCNQLPDPHGGWNGTSHVLLMCMTGRAFPLNALHQSQRYSRAANAHRAGHPAPSPRHARVALSCSFPRLCRALAGRPSEGEPDMSLSAAEDLGGAFGRAGARLLQHKSCCSHCHLCWLQSVPWHSTWVATATGLTKVAVGAAAFLQRRERD